MPVEVTDDYIHIRVRDPELFDKYGTQELEGEKKILVVWGRHKDDHTRWDVQKFMFPVDQWTREDAEAWVKEHKDDFKSESRESESATKHTTREIWAELRKRGLHLAKAVAIEGELKEWIHLMPIGHWEEFRGGGPGYGEPMDITAEHIAQMATNFERFLHPMLVDYEHNSLWGDTKAAGWITEVRGEADGLWGRVEWTKTAEQQIIEGEYRYLSPVWDLHYEDAKSGEKVGARIISATLTNTPFFEELEQKLAAKEATMEELKKIAAALGLAEDATLEEILAEIKKLKEAAAPEAAKKLQEMLTAVRNELRVASTATAEEMIAAIRKRGEGESELAARVKELEAAQRKATAEKLVGKYQGEGKIVATDLPWALEQAEANPEAFEKLMASAPVKVPPQGPPKRPLDAGGKPIPTETEIATAQAMGMDPQAVAEQRAKRESQG